MNKNITILEILKGFFFFSSLQKESNHYSHLTWSFPSFRYSVTSEFQIIILLSK